ncbi:uncharacterized protein PG986_012518 [Apiospora aurea]|uniref:Uncharacterized protein n=1 Tax=Apiospora aurea TaxID=335848 RepID=A0ABR1Q079_9PEZI
MDAYIATFRSTVTKSLEGKKKDDKLMATVDSLKQAVVETVGQALKSQPASPNPLNQNKFLNDFWKSFDARLKEKELAEVRKQLKSKGIPDLKTTMGSIIHATFYDMVVLPGLDSKKPKPANDKFVGIFVEKFDKELDNILKKKEFKMYKDASAEVAANAIQRVQVLSSEAEEMDKELGKLKNQPSRGPTKLEQIQRNQLADLEQANKDLESKVQNLEGQLKMQDDPDTDGTDWKSRYDNLLKKNQEEVNIIDQLEADNYKLQEDLNKERTNSKKLNQGQGSAQGRVKKLEEEVKEQRDTLIERQKQLNDREEELKELQGELKESQTARYETNEDYEKLQEKFEAYKTETAKSSSGSNEAEHLETIKNLRAQAAKDKKEIDDLKAAKATERTKLEEDASNAGKQAESAKTLIRSLREELDAVKKDTDKEREEKTSIQEKHKQLETTHREITQKNANLEKQHEELTKKHHEVVKAQKTGKAAVDKEAAKKLADLEKERDQLKATCKEYKEAENSLKAITAEQNKQLKQLEAAKAAAADAEKQLAAAKEERDRLQKERDQFQEAGKELNATMAEKEKKLKQLEADGAKQLQDLQKKNKALEDSQSTVKADNEKLNATVKEQKEQLSNLAAAKAGGKVAEKKIQDLERQIKELEVTRDEHKKQKGASDTRVAELEQARNGLQINIKGLQAEAKKREAALARLTAVEGTQKKLIKELEGRIKGASTGSGSGKGKDKGKDLTPLTEEEEEEEEETAGTTTEAQRKQITEAQQTISKLTKENRDMKRDLTRLQSGYNHTEKRAGEWEVQVETLKKQLAEAKAAQKTSQTAEATAQAAATAADARAAEAATQAAAAQAATVAADARATEATNQAAAAEAAAAAAIANAATATATTATESRGTETAGTAGPVRTMGEVVLPERVTAPVGGILRNSIFTGAANLFNGGAGGTVGTGNRGRTGIGGGGGGGGGGGEPGTPATQAEDWDGFNNMMFLCAVITILAFLTMGAEGHKASLWMAANHLTRAQYANEWYYLTIPLPQLSYAWDLFMACVK